MKATITHKVFYQDIPSASGLEVVHGHMFVIGDDSPYLYQLNDAYQLIRKTALADTAGFSSGRVAKKDKLDLESITSFQRGGKTHLLLLGSGASEPRMRAFIVDVDGESGSLGQVKSYSLNDLYRQLQENRTVVGGGLLNIEGAAVANGKLYLLQRAVDSEPNILLTYSLTDFLNYLEHDDVAPTPVIQILELPKLKGAQAGLSGAVVFENRLFFTASVEDTKDAIADGEVLGSYAGYIDLGDLTQKATKAFSTRSALIMNADGTPYTGKAESIYVSRGETTTELKAIIVSDDDQGHSELLEVALSLE